MKIIVGMLQLPIMAGNTYARHLRDSRINIVDAVGIGFVLLILLIHRLDISGVPSAFALAVFKGRNKDDQGIGILLHQSVHHQLPRSHKGIGTLFSPLSQGGGNVGTEIVVSALQKDQVHVLRLARNGSAIKIRKLFTAPIIHGLQAL